MILIFSGIFHSDFVSYAIMDTQDRNFIDHSLREIANEFMLDHFDWNYADKEALRDEQVKHCG